MAFQERYRKIYKMNKQYNGYSDRGQSTCGLLAKILFLPSCLSFLSFALLAAL
jgi:hypothetical protein